MKWELNNVVHFQLAKAPWRATRARSHLVFVVLFALFLFESLNNYHKGHLFSSLLLLSLFLPVCRVLALSLSPLCFRSLLAGVIACHWSNCVFLLLLLLFFFLHKHNNKLRRWLM